MQIVWNEGTNTIGNPCAVVDADTGGVWLTFTRNNDGVFVTKSKDDGETWSDVEFDDTLLSPQCQASIVRFTDQSRNGKNRVLFSNPASKARKRMTVRISYDECKTWNEGRALNEGPSAYSDLCIAPDMTICCLYERGDKGTYERLTFARSNLEWLSNGTERLEKANR